MSTCIKPGLPDCCKPATGHGCTTYCVTVAIAQYPPNDGGSVTGVTVTLNGTVPNSSGHGTSPWSTSGSIDGSNQFCYTLPTTGTIPSITSATVTNSCGATATSGFYQPLNSTTCVAYFLECHVTVNCAITEGANPTVSIEPYNSYWKIEYNGGTAVCTFCMLSAYIESPFPAEVTFTATSLNDDGSQNCLWPYVCCTLDIECDQGPYSCDLTQEYWGDCYFPACGCDLGCGEGKGPSYRGLISKQMQVRFSSSTNMFANDEGVWITLTGSDTGFSGTGIGGYVWTGAGNNGNFMSSSDPCGGYFNPACCQLNVKCKYEKLNIAYQSVLITLTPNSISYVRQSGSNPGDRCINKQCQYNYIGCGCCCLWDDATGLLCGDCTTGYSTCDSLDFCPDFGYEVRSFVCSPCDFIVGISYEGGYPFPFWTTPTGASYTNILWQCEVRETC